MKCPICDKRQLRRRVSDATGRWYLYCESCKEERDIVEKPDETWEDRYCVECSRTMRHDLIGKLSICRGCNKVDYFAGPCDGPEGQGNAGRGE